MGLSRLDHIGPLIGHALTEQCLLETSEAACSALMNGFVKGICIVRENRSLYWNPAFANIVGFEDPDGMFGEHAESGSHLARFRMRIFDHANAVLAGEDVGRTFEFEVVSREGMTVWLENHVDIVLWRKRPAAMFTVTDISERLTREANARREMARLSELCRHSYLTELSATLAHELNQPLAALGSYVGGCIRRLESGNIEDETLLEVLEKIQGQVVRANNIVRWIRGHDRKQDDPWRVIDVNALIKETLDVLATEFEDRAIVVRLDLDAGLPTLDASPIQIQQVILNILRNGAESIEEARSSDRTLTVRTSLGRGNFVNVSIKDSGPGIADETMERLFDPFFTTRPMGMGLGLAICRSVVETHGGRLWAENIEQGGAAFHLCLPPSNPTPPRTGDSTEISAHGGAA